MAIRPDALPTDLAALTEMVLALDAENEKLRVAMQTLKEMMFGKRSERLAALVAEQLALELDDLETGVTPPAPTTEDLPATKPAGKPRKKASRNIGALPKHLPRCEQVLEPDATACPCCEGRLHKIGEDVSEVLDVIPAILRVLRTIRPKYACRGCTDGVVQAKVLPRLIESGMASTALVTHVVVSKFAWYLPLYRQVQILASQGIHLDRATLAGWVKRAAWWLKSLYELQLRTIQASPRLFCDETPMPVLDPGRRRTRICQFWAHAVDDRPWGGPSPPAVAYVFADGRGTEEIAGQLTGFSGILQVDGYAAYKALAREHGGAIQLAFCLAHARRKFVEVYKTTQSPFAREVIERLQAVYVIEAEIRGSSAEQRLAARRTRTAPLMETLRARLTAMVGQLFSQSKLAEAINYALNHWDGLTLFLSDGRVEVGRVDDWRGGCRSRGVAVVRRLSPNAGASFRTVAPFPVAARQTGRAELPHPAFSHPIRPSLSAGRSAGGECGRGRASHRDTRPGSGGTRRLVSQLGASTSGGVVDLCTS
jgi:transposase